MIETNRRSASGRLRLGLTTCLLSAIVWVSCSDDDDNPLSPTPSPNPEPVVIEFADAVFWPVIDQPQSITAADLNGDGLIDLLSDNAGSIAIHTNNGDSTFGVAHTCYGIWAAVGLTVADLNGDGFHDLAVSQLQRAAVSVFYNDGQGAFTDSTIYPTGSRARESIAADFSGDGLVDLAVVGTADIDACGVPGVVRLFFNSGDTAFIDTARYSVGCGSVAFCALDIDRDGDLDLAVGDEFSPSLTLLYNDGTGDFSPLVVHPTLSVGARSYRLCSADLDGDGHSDLAVATTQGTVVVFINTDGSGLVRQQVLETGQTGPQGVSAGDLNGDGYPELVLTNCFDQRIAVVENQGDGQFLPAVYYPVGECPYGTAIADLDGDGDNDLAVCNAGSDDISILYNRTGEPAASAR